MRLPRRFIGKPFFRTPVPVQLDPFGHFPVPDFGCGNIGHPLAATLSQFFGKSAFTAAGAAGNQNVLAIRACPPRLPAVSAEIDKTARSIRITGKMNMQV